MNVECDICAKTFSSSSNMNKHRRQVHCMDASIPAYHSTVWNHKCLEDDCKISFRRNMDLVEHLHDEHGLHIDVQELEFDNFPEFNTWKWEMEVQEKCNYVLARGKSSKVSGDEITTYICNRSGKYRSRTAKDRRVAKLQGSCKIERACISEMRLTKKTDRIHVHWVATHYGHTVDLQHLRLSRQDRVAIASDLAMGASKSEILDDMKERVWQDMDVKRVHLLNGQDISNIRRSLCVQEDDDCDAAPVESGGHHAHSARAHLQVLSDQQLQHVLLNADVQSGEEEQEEVDNQSPLYRQLCEEFSALYARVCNVDCRAISPPFVKRMRHYVARVNRLLDENEEREVGMRRKRKRPQGCSDAEVVEELNESLGAAGDVESGVGEGTEDENNVYIIDSLDELTNYADDTQDNS